MQKTRKLIAMLLAVLTLLSMSTVGLFSVSALPENAIVNGTEGNDASGINGEVLGLMGDADGSEKINVKDATQIQKHAAKLIQLDEASMTLADVDLNDKVNVKDATAIQKWVAKIAVDAPINCLVYIPATETEPTTTASVPATVVVVPETTSTADEPTTAATGDEPVVTVPVIKPTFVTEPTEATTKATEPTEATTKATEPTEATTKATEATTKATEATTKATEPTENTTEETIVTEPTEATIVTEATIGAGYYLVGTINGQTLEDADSLTADRKFSKNGSDYVLYWTTVGGDAYKVAYFDGTSITKLFKAESEPYYKIGETSNKIGFCKVEFNPDGKSSWSYTYMTVNVTDERPTTPVTDPTESVSTQPDEVDAGYYLVGTINGQTLESADSLTADRKFSKNGSDYVLYWTTKGGDAYKVAYFDGTSITKLFKAESEPYYKIGETSNKIGFCKVEFNPDGKSTWSYTYMTVNVTDEKPTETTEATSKATDPTETSKATEPTQSGDLTAGYYLVGTINGKEYMTADTLTADRKFSANGSDYVLYWTTVGGDAYKVAYFDGTSITKLFKAEGENFYNIGATSNKVGYCKVEFNPDGKSSWSYTYMTVNVTDDNPTDPTPSDPTPSDPTPSDPSGVTEGYYLVGTLNGQNCWSADSITADRKLKENPGADGEYMLDWTFYNGDQIKVVYFDGTAIKTWYNDGGDNYGIGSSKAGACTMYFRPDGNSEWSYYYFTVQPK